MKANLIKSLILRILPCALCMVMMLCVEGLYADFGLPMPDVYNFGPEGRPFEAFNQDYGKPNQMMDILPGRPVAAHEKDGSRVYFSADGAVTCSVGVDGSMTFSMGSQMSKSYDADGNLTRQTQLIKGTDRIEITNGNGEVTGYEQLGYGGKVVQAFDAQNNLTETYQYNAYGKALEYVLNELTLTKTIYNADGTPGSDVDFNGAKVASYKYDSSGNLQNKVDQYGNVTYFNKYGNMTYTTNYQNQKLCEYNYVTDDEGRYVLDNLVNLAAGSSNGSLQGDITYFKDGRTVETVASQGGIATQYCYNGTQLVYSFNTRTEQTTWYDVSGKQTCSTLNGNVTQEYLYYKSRLVGIYDDTNQTVTMYRYERQDQTAQIFASSSKPTAEQIEKYYENLGFMSDIGASEQDAAITVPAFVSNIYKSAHLANSAQPTADQSVTAFNVINDDSLNPLTANSGLLLSRTYYSADGKIQCSLSHDSADGGEWVTTIYIGQGDASMGAASNQTSITLEGDQTSDPTLADTFWNAVTSGNQSISDIVSGGGALGSFAAAIKSVHISGANINQLSAGQVCNLFGWHTDGAATAQYLLDVKTRANNAGSNGTVSITYGYNSMNGPIFACEVSATDINNFTVAGTIGGKALGLESEFMYKGVLGSAPIGSPVTPDINALDQLWAANTLNNQPASYLITSNLEKVNGVTRVYAPNGAVVQESDTILDQVTNFDNAQRVTTVFQHGVLMQSYAYNDNGSLQSIKTTQFDENSKFSGYATTFYVGFGNSQFNQPTITVYGDQVGNAALAVQLWNAINNGQSIANIAMGNGSSAELAKFTNTLQTITVNNGTIMNMSDQLATNLLGLDVHGLIVQNNLSVLQTWAGSAADYDMFTLTYYDGVNGIRGVYANKITKDQSTLTLNNLPEVGAATSALADVSGAAPLSNVAADFEKSMMAY